MRFPGEQDNADHGAILAGELCDVLTQFGRNA
jgi:hypothetical protein